MTSSSAEPIRSRGDRRRDDDPREPLVRRLDRRVAERPEPGARRAPSDRAQKYAPDRDERPEVQRDVEGLVERVVALQVRPSRRATERGSGGPRTRSAGARSRPGRARGRAPASWAACRDRPPLRAPSAATAARAARAGGARTRRSARTAAWYSRGRPSPGVNGNDAICRLCAAGVLDPRPRWT